MNKDCIFNIINHPEIKYYNNYKYCNCCMALEQTNDCKDCSFFKSVYEWTMDSEKRLVKKTDEGKEL